MLVLSGIAVIALGFLLRFNPMLVIAELRQDLTDANRVIESLHKRIGDAAQESPRDPGGTPSPDTH